MLKLLGCLNDTRSFVNRIGADVPRNPDGTIGGAEDDEFHQKVHSGVMDVIGIAGLASSITTLALTEGHIVDASCYSTLLLSPYTAYQKYQLRMLGGLRKQQNITREHVDSLKQQNKQLATSIDTLETQVNLLEGVESQLDAAARNARTSVDRLVVTVQRTRDIQAKIKRNLEKQVLADLMSAVVHSDRDGDLSLTDRELNRLLVRLGRPRPGVRFHATNFRKVVPTTPVSLAQILKVARNLLDDSVPEKDDVFTIHPEELLTKTKK